MKPRVHLSLRMLDLIDRYVTVRDVGDGNVDRADVQALHVDAAPPTSLTAIAWALSDEGKAPVVAGQQSRPERDSAQEFRRVWTAA